VKGPLSSNLRLQEFRESFQNGINPAAIAKEYEAEGVAALSILTDIESYHGEWP